MADDLTPEMDAYREAVRSAMSWVDDERALDAVLAVPNPEVERLRAGMADVWEAGRNAGVDDQEAWDGWRYAKKGHPIANPYREGGDV